MATLGRPVSLSINGTTISDPLSISVIIDDEMVGKLSSNNRKEEYFLGEERKGLTVSFRDQAAFKTLKKGTRITSVVASIESAVNTDATTEVGSPMSLEIKTSAIVESAVDHQTTTDGSPGEYSVTIILCQSVAGAEGKLEIDGVEV